MKLRRPIQSVRAPYSLQTQKIARRLLLANTKVHMTSFRRFTGLQYYLAHARNTVHVVFDLPRDVTEDAFVSLVADITKEVAGRLW